MLGFLMPENDCFVIDRESSSFDLNLLVSGDLLDAISEATNANGSGLAVLTVRMADGSL